MNLIPRVFSALQRTRVIFLKQNLPNNKNLRLNSCAASLSPLSAFGIISTAQKQKEDIKREQNRRKTLKATKNAFKIMQEFFFLKNKNCFVLQS